MRSHPGSFDLSFIVPRDAVALGGDGTYSAENGCEIEIAAPLVRIRGFSREAVFNAASDVVRDLGQDSPTSITAILRSPARPSGADSWSIIVGADVAFSPTSIDPYFPTAAA